MARELSYSQLKTANDARLSEETRLERKKKDVLILIADHLLNNGYLNSAQKLEQESGISLSKCTVCDNIDLLSVLQEYETYYEFKFNRPPRLTRRLQEGTNNTRASKPPRKPSATVQQPTAQSQNSSDPNKCIPGPTSSFKRHGSLPKLNGEEDTSSIATTNNSDGAPLFVLSQAAPVRNSKRGDMGGGGGHTPAAILSGTTPVLSDVSDIPVLKPLAGFVKQNAEMAELVNVISKDIFLGNPDVRWGDIAGLETAKRLVKEAVVLPIKYPQLFTGILSPWKGLLLYGPPGTGKTMLAKAVATECRTTFFNVSASSIVSKWRGDSEKLVRTLFELARFHAPSTIFIDELESIMSHRGGAGSDGGGGGQEHEASARMKTELLIQMDGLSRSNDLVFLLGATNIPWILDAAMLRRLEKRILVPLPSEAARLAMFRHHLPPVVVDNEGEPLLRTELDYQLLASITGHYSGSDIKLVCKEAAMRPVRKIFDVLEAEAEANSESSNPPILMLEPVLTADVQAALAITKPSGNVLAEKYISWQKEFESA